MKSTRKYWPLDYDPEVEIYENPSWDLPGYKRFTRVNNSRPQPGKFRRAHPDRK